MARVRSVLRLARVTAEVVGAHGVIAALANAVEAKDSTTEMHCQRLAGLAHELGMRAGLEPAALKGLVFGALLHDIGKIGVSDAILTKPGPLTAQEWHEMRQHPVIGERICEPLATAAQFAPDRPPPPRALGRRRATRTGCAARRSRSARGSSGSSTPTTRSSTTARTDPPGASSRRSRSSGARPAPSSIPSWCASSCRSWSASSATSADSGRPGARGPPHGGLTMSLDTLLTIALDLGVLRRLRVHAARLPAPPRARPARGRAGVRQPRGGARRSAAPARLPGRSGPWPARWSSRHCSPIRVLVLWLASFVQPIPRIVLLGAAAAFLGLTGPSWRCWPPA